jgi:membrane-associated phospholipid phosphatase
MAVLAATVVATAAFMFASGVRVTFVGSALPLLIVAALGGAGFWLERRRNMPLFGAMLYATAYLGLFFTLIGVASYAGAAMGLPLQDHRLAAADQALAFDWRALFAWMEQHRTFGLILAALYGSSVLQMALVILILGYGGRLDRLAEFCFLVAATALVIVTLSALFPAVGAFAYYGIERSAYSFLSPLSGDYHLAHFRALRAGEMNLLDPMKLGGIVTFPSFHTALAMATGWALRSVPYLRWPMFVVSALVVVSTMTEGGHYLIDVFSGALIAVIAMRVAAGPARETRTLPGFLETLKAIRGAAPASQ